MATLEELIATCSDALPLCRSGKMSREAMTYIIERVAALTLTPAPPCSCSARAAEALVRIEASWATDEQGCLVGTPDPQLAHATLRDIAKNPCRPALTVEAVEKWLRETALVSTKTADRIADKFRAHFAREAR